ncbi:MAG: hypothetical protein KA384_07140 [Leptotrichiaceae bacterium]|nr:hypothetical protein [Leptotrichiaceae bacterium]
MNIFKRREMLLCIVYGLFFIATEYMSGNILYKDWTILKYKGVLVPIFSMLFIWFREESQEKYKANVSKHIYVTQLQYDREFSIYVEVFESLFNVVAATQNLAPIRDVLSSIEEENQKIYKERNIELIKNYDKFSETIIKYSPFYETDIKKVLLEIRKICQTEEIAFRIFKIENTDPIERFNYKESEERKKMIESKKEEVELLVRNRLKKMKII